MMIKFKDIIHESPEKNYELEVGIQVELEHTDNRDEAKKIALDHMKENSNYYSKLYKSGLIDEKPALDLAKKYFKKE